MKSLFPTILCCSIFSCFGLFSQHENPQKGKPKVKILEDSSKIKVPDKRFAFDGVDGPYFINDTLYRVNAENELKKEARYRTDSICVKVKNPEENQFFISLAPEYKIPASSYLQPEKLIIISDIEGNYNALASF